MGWEWSNMKNCLMRFPRPFRSIMKAIVREISSLRVIWLHKQGFLDPRKGWNFKNNWNGSAMAWSNMQSCLISFLRRVRSVMTAIVREITSLSVIWLHKPRFSRPSKGLKFQKSLKWLGRGLIKWEKFISKVKHSLRAVFRTKHAKLAQLAP